MPVIDHTSAMEKALAQLKLNQRNLCKGMSPAIQKLQARENEESIQSLSLSLEDAKNGYRSIPHGHCTHPRCKLLFLDYLDTQSRLAQHEGGSVMVLNANSPKIPAISLGERLAQTMADEKNGTTEAARKAALHESQKALALFEKVQEFFTRARKHFEQAILSDLPTKQVFIKVGGRSFTPKPGALHEQDLYTVINGYRYTGDELNSMAKNGQFHALWVEFQEWAVAQGLKARWHYDHDGGGMDSWWNLRVQPMH